MGEDLLHLTHEGACQTAFQGTPEACGRVLLVGEDNPQSSAPEHALFPYPEGCAGNRLMKILGLRPATYLALWRTNLCSPRWSKKDAASRMIHLTWPDAPWDTIVLLGRKCADVFSAWHDVAPFATVRHDVVGMNGAIEDRHKTFQVVSLPHPSGRNLLWNDPRSAATARARAAGCGARRAVGRRPVSPLAKKIQWVVLLLIQEQPRKLTWRAIASTTGFPAHDVEDAIWGLCQEGVVSICLDSTLEAL